MGKCRTNWCCLSYSSRNNYLLQKTRGNLIIDITTNSTHNRISSHVYILYSICREVYLLMIRIKKIYSFAVNFYSHSQVIINLFTVSMDLSFLNISYIFHICRIRQHAVFWNWLHSHRIMFLRFIHVAAFNKCWQVCGETSTLLQGELVKPFWKKNTFLQFHKTLKHKIHMN